MMIEIPDEKVKKFVAELLENLPECVISFQCTKFNYKENIFELIDQETGKLYTLTLDKAIKGFEIFVNAIIKGELHFDGMDSGSILDGGQYDAFCIDAVIQFSLLGECPYG